MLLCHLHNANLRQRILTLGATASLALGLIPGTAAAGKRFPTQTSALADSPDYISALATANRFLQAWQSHDEETGILLLTDRAKQRTSEAGIAAFFSATARPAYEISRGLKIRAGRYAFPVALYDPAPNRQSRKRTRRIHLIVARTGKNDWAVDKLP